MTSATQEVAQVVLTRCAKVREDIGNLRPSSAPRCCFQRLSRAQHGRRPREDANMAAELADAPVAVCRASAAGSVLQAPTFSKPPVERLSKLSSSRGAPERSLSFIGNLKA